MRLARRIPARAGAAVLLAAATAALVAAPYDDGTCRNVVSAWTTPAASVVEVEPPEEPAGLRAAQQELEDAEAQDAALDDERAKASRAEAAARTARQKADAAEVAAEEAPSDTGTDSWEMDSAELDVDAAESSLDVAEDWLDIVAGDDYGFYDSGDVAEAQEDVDDARTDLAEAQAVLDDLLAAEAAAESAAAAAAARVDTLTAKADAAEETAERSSDILAAKERKVDAVLEPVLDRVEDLEEGHQTALAAWANEQRVAETEVVARNAVRDDCRENGLWRAGLAGADLLLLGALGVREALSRLRRPAG